MKIFVLCIFVTVQISISDSKVLPEYLPQFCPKSVSNYNECTIKTLSKLGPYLVKGVREINFPKLNPLNIPFFTINRTVNEYVSIYSITKNMLIWGLNTTHIKYFKFDPENKNGELQLHIPHIRTTMEYDVKGRLISVDLEDAGVLKGNITDTGLFFKFSLRPVDRLGVKYYTLDDFDVKSTTGDAHISMASNNPNNQFAADLITNFVNEDPKRAADAVQPIYDESMVVFYGHLAKQVLSAIPADELIPEQNFA